MGWNLLMQLIDLTMSTIFHFSNNIIDIAGSNMIKSMKLKSK